MHDGVRVCAEIEARRHLRRRFRGGQGQSVGEGGQDDQRILADRCERRLAEVAAGIAQAGGCTAESKYLRRYPALINAVEQTSLAVEAAALTVGRENVEPNTPPISGAEDFAFMLEKKPGAYIMIGNGGTEEGGCHNVHSPLYDFNDAILTTGAAYWVNLVQLELGDAA